MRTSTGKTVFLCVALAILLVPSCKKRFDYDHLEAVKASGCWKLPIGTVKATLADVMKQLNDYDLISYDEDGNLQVAYDIKIDQVIKGSDLMTINNMDYDAHFEVENAYPYQMEQPVDTFSLFDHEIMLSTEGSRIETFVIKSGYLTFQLHSTIGEFQRIVLRSDNLVHEDGSPWFEFVNPIGYDTVDLSGVALVVGEENKLLFTHEVYYQLYDEVDSTLSFDFRLGITDFVLRQLSGYVDAYESTFDYDTTFDFPIDKLEGHLKLVDAKLQVETKNTFDLYANLQVDEARLYGGGASPSFLFSHYPMVLRIEPSADFSYAMDETLGLEFDTRYNAVRFAGSMVFNPDGLEQLISVYDTSSLGVAVSGRIPLKFNVPGVRYRDTIDINLSEVDAPEMIQEVLLGLTIHSELPFNLQAQLLTYDSETERITDSLLTNESFIAGAFDGVAATTVLEIPVTHGRLKNLVEADRLIMRFGLDTDNHDVLLNLKNGLEVTVKADLVYDGEIPLN